MSLPYTIENGTVPDADEVMANFNYLAAGKGFMVGDNGTYAELKELARANPTIPFLGIVTSAADAKGLYFYSGDATQGDEGFTMLTGGGGGVTI